MPYRTKDQVASEFIAEGKRRGITQRGIVICIATGLVESNLTVYANSKVPESMSLPHDAVGSDGYSVGPLQQQVRKGPTGQWWWGDAATCMDPTKSAGLFYDRLARLDYNGPNSPGSYAQDVQDSAYPDRYDERMAEAQNYYNRLAGAPAVTDPNRPDYNEFPLWSPNSSSRGGTKVDAVFIHTQEGGGGNDAALNLAQFLANPANQVSYHYVLSQASDGGVTVIDCVDTDEESWSVLSANPRSINLCFAGSRASWTRDQWMQQAKAIDVAAYLIVQDCRKYQIPTKVVAPPYTDRIPGISDHRYVTKILGDGTHTDVGDQFPWDVLTAAVNKYVSGAPITPTPGGPPVSNVPDYTHETWDQVRGRWAMLGDQTLVEAVAQVRDKVCGTNDAGKTGVRFV
jgi:N-acetyl-anhydromuramyl-L-alanine amidase AmpD